MTNPEIEALRERFREAERRNGGVAATGSLPDLPTPGRAYEPEPTPEQRRAMATGGADDEHLTTRRLTDPPDPYEPEGDLVGDDPSSMAGAILRERYQTDAAGNPSGRIIYSDERDAFPTVGRPDPYRKG